MVEQICYNFIHVACLINTLTYRMRLLFFGGCFVSNIYTCVLNLRFFYTTHQSYTNAQRPGNNQKNPDDLALFVLTLPA